MSIEITPPSASPKPPAAKPQGSAEPTGESASFVSVLADSMEPVEKAAPEAQAAPAEETAADAPAAQSQPDPMLLLAQSVAMGMDAVVSTPPSATAPMAGTRVPQDAQPALSSEALESAAVLATGEAGARGEARPLGASSGAKVSAARLPREQAATGLQPESEGPALARAMPASGRAAQANRDGSDTSTMQSGRTMAMRVFETRVASEAAAEQARGTASAQAGGSAAVVASLPEAGNLSRDAGNPRAIERSVFRPLLATSGAAGVAGWAEHAMSNSASSNAGVPTYAPDVTASSPAMAVAEKVHYWVSRGVQNAELQLDAFGGGSVEVRVSVQGNEAQVEFRSDQPEARRLLQEAMPQLRNMLGDQGLQLSGGFVGTSAGNESGARQRENGAPSANASVTSVAAPISDATTATVRERGRALDVFV